MRRHDIDSIRVIAFGLLIFYHVGMLFVPWDFHFKNNVTYEGLVFPMLFLNQWRLSLLFLVSGMGTYYALSKRSGTQFAMERIKRLFIPFIFGMIFIIPPQIYVERVIKGQFTGNYFQYWTTEAFTGMYPEGNISWHHLWFILYLLIFSLILIPTFVYLRNHPQTWIIRTLKSLISKPFGIYSFILLPLLWRIFLAPYFPQTNALLGDWFNLVNYCTFFFYGYLLLSLKETFWETVTNNRLTYLISGVIAFSVLMLIWFATDDFTGREYISDLIRTFNTWSWILTITGYASVYLNKPSKMLSYANEAVYPFYILHQSVMMVLAYYLVNVNMSFLPKFSLMVIGTFGISWLIYEFGIRRYSLIRPLFGLKNKNKA